MSFEASAWAIKQSPEIGTEKLALIAISDCFNKQTTRCDPSMEYISSIALCKKRSAIRVVDSLARQGYISIKKEAGKRNNYTLNIDCEKAKTSATHDTTTTSATHDTTPVPPMTPEPVSNQEINQLPFLEASASCPHQKIIALYHEHLPTLRRVKIWSKEREKLLKQRWRENDKHKTLEFWANYFKYVSSSQFLVGEKTNFQCDIEWLINKSNFIKVIEGKYHD